MSDYVKVKRHVLTNIGYKQLSYLTMADSVELNNGNDLETELSNINRKTDSSITIAKDTINEVTVTASQMSGLLNILQFTTWNGGSY